RFSRDWSSDVCSSDLYNALEPYIDEMTMQLLHGLVLELGVLLQRRVEVVDVRGVVLAVVDLHGHFVDVGLKGVVRVRQRRKLVRSGERRGGRGRGRAL